MIPADPIICFSPLYKICTPLCGEIIKILYSHPFPGNLAVVFPGLPPVLHLVSTCPRKRPNQKCSNLYTSRIFLITSVHTVIDVAYVIHVNSFHYSFKLELFLTILYVKTSLRVFALVRSYLFFGKKHIDCLAHFHLLPLTWSLKKLNGLCSLQKFTLDGCLPEKNVECDASK